MGQESRSRMIGAGFCISTCKIQLRGTSNRWDPLGKCSAQVFHLGCRIFDLLILAAYTLMSKKRAAIVLAV